MFEEKKKNFKIRAIPAATSVEEWTKAEIGVGAAIAAGSQEENGNCALFVSAVINKSIVGTNTRTLIEVGVIKRKKQNKIIISILLERAKSKILFEIIISNKRKSNNKEK